MLLNNTIFAAWQQLPSPQITQAMANLGFDWVILDLEHSSITIQEVEAIFISAERCRVKPFARLPSADPYLARRLLDIGAVGLLVPMVTERNSFDRFAEHCFFPPKGKRGLGLVRVNDWGDGLINYFENFKPILIAQIETKQGSDNIVEILESKYLDGIMIGPYDLSADMGIPGKFTEPVFKASCTHINKEAKKFNKMIGFHQVEPNKHELDNRIQEKYDFIVYGTDVVAIRHALRGIKK